MNVVCQIISVNIFALLNHNSVKRLITWAYICDILAADLRLTVERQAFLGVTVTYSYDKIERQCPVDPSRVYLTGISMGGYGTWALAAEAPGRFAAVAPICGGGDPATARQLKKLPIWNFHGAKDPTIPIELSRRMVDAVKKAGGNVRFTVYPPAGHDSWTATYNNPALYRWLLSKKRG